MSFKSVIAATAVAGVFIVAGNSAASAQTKEETAKPPQNVVVQAGDSLVKIATQHQSTYTRLFDANAQIAHPDVIHPGENVRIPAADEQLQSRPLPEKVVAKPVKAFSKKPTQSSGSQASTAGGDVWDKLAKCEAGGNWNTNTGNGYSGGLQFSPGTWKAAGGSGSAANASREEQITRAETVKAKQGWGAWPACSKKLGLR